MILRSMILVIFSSSFLACSSGSDTEMPPPQNNVVETFQQKLDRVVDNSNIHGATARLSDGNKFWIAASGLANKTNQVAITSDAQMRIASMTKTLVAVTMLRLIEEGHFGLDDVITSFLSAELAQAIPNSNTITVRHLLSMMSGIRDYTEETSFNNAVEAMPQKIWSAEEVIGFIFDKPANFAPGEAWAYSNSNFVICDIIVAQAMGTSLAEQMRRIIFSPLAMDSTYVENQETSSENGKSITVRGYDGDVDITDINDGIGFGDGGVVSTVSDLSIFLTKVFGEKVILNEDSLASMENFHPTEDYGLGLERRNNNVGSAVGHNGSSSGFGGDMMYFPEKNITWVILYNQLDYNGSDVSSFQTLSTVLSE